MKFVLTSHAKQRLAERNLPSPLEVNLKPVKSSSNIPLKRRYKFVYWCYKKTIVYACYPIDVGVYCVLTAFDINET